MRDITINSRNIAGALLRAKEGKRLTKIQGLMLAEDFERKSSELEKAYREIAGLRTDVEAAQEFCGKIIRQSNETNHMLSSVLGVKISGTTTRDKDGVYHDNWAATDENGDVITEGHATVYGAFEAVLNIQLNRTEQVKNV